MKQKPRKGLPQILSRPALRGLLWLVPILGVISLLVFNVRKTSVDLQPIAMDSIVVDSAKSQHYPTKELDGDIKIVERFSFDPNTATYNDFRRLGLSKSCAASIIKYRSRGKIFAIKEDFAVCYGLSDADYARLEPLIVIGEKYRLRPHEERNYDEPTERFTQRKHSRRDSLFVFDPNKVGEADFIKLGFSRAQWGVFDRYRTMVGRFESAEDFAECYVVGDQKLEKLRQYTVITPITRAELVELNRADTAQLRQIKGIGAVTAKRIVDYRERLGGYHSAEQLCEVEGVTEYNFEKISKQIWVDSCEITKIDVNFAPSKQLIDALSAHPYAGGRVVRKLMKQKQLKGGWRTIGDLEKDDILSTQQAKKLAPYLLFIATN